MEAAVDQAPLANHAGSNYERCSHASAGLDRVGRYGRLSASRNRESEISSGTVVMRLVPAPVNQIDAKIGGSIAVHDSNGQWRVSHALLGTCLLKNRAPSTARIILADSNPSDKGNPSS